MTNVKHFELLYVENDLFNSIPIYVQNIMGIYSMGEKIYNRPKESLRILLFDDGTLIDNDEYLQTVNDGTELLICTEEQNDDLRSYFINKVFILNKIGERRTENLKRKEEIMYFEYNPKACSNTCQDCNLYQDCRLYDLHNQMNDINLK